MVAGTKIQRSKIQLFLSLLLPDNHKELEPTRIILFHDSDSVYVAKKSLFITLKLLIKYKNHSRDWSLILTTFTNISCAGFILH